MSGTEYTGSLELLSGELKNFYEIAKHIRPSAGEIPTLSGIEVYGGAIPLNGIIGGDHIVYVNLKKRFDLPARIKRATAEGRQDIVANLERCRRKAGIGLMDVSGHHATDMLLAAMLHQAFLLGAQYELDIYGDI